MKKKPFTIPPPPIWLYTAMAALVVLIALLRLEEYQ
jgi:hypothetical protein